MQFVWPFKAEYRVVYLTSDYSLTVIGRSKRDYAWIMARSPRIPESDYQRLRQLLREQGYDPERLRLVPQHWPEADAPGQGAASAAATDRGQAQAQSSHRR